MTSLVVSGNRLKLTGVTSSYFYSQFNCIAATNTYGGIGLRIKAAAGVKFSVQLESSSTCTESTQTVLRTTTQLGWTFDGTEKFYSIPFSLYTGLDLTKLNAILFTAQTGVITLVPMAFYCGNTASEYVLPTTPTAPTSAVVTVPATTATAAAFVIDQFASSTSNALGFWHGGDDDTGLSYSNGKLTIAYTDSDYAYYTQMTATCRDITTYQNAYIHIAYTGSAKFSIALQQHNSGCNDAISPYPETWDEVYAANYASGGNIYVPIAHFDIVKTRAIGIALKGFANDAPTVLSKIEIVQSIPAGFKVPARIPTAKLVFACTRPNSFAFAIDDGDPMYAQQVLQTIKAANIKVTFFTVGAPLLDAGTNLSSVYREMLSEGHQVALHSFTHPKMEGLATVADIDWELDNDIAAVQKTLGISSTYFRPPFGNTGARFRERVAAKLGAAATIVNWSVDVQDWLWGTSSTPEKQLAAFTADVAKGGNLVVLHYLYPSTVGYLEQFINLAKATGKQLMRVDQCMMDPNAPPL